MAELSARVIEFLSAGTRTGMLGYVAADGRPLVAPVWFVVDDGQLVFNTGRDTSKGRALARDSRVVICVDDPHAPIQVDPVHGFDPAAVTAPATQATFGGGADPFSQILNGAMSVLSHGTG